MKVHGDGNIIINSNNSIKKGKSRKSRFSKIILIIAAVATILLTLNTFIDKFKENKRNALKVKKGVATERSIKPSEK